MASFQLQPGTIFASDFRILKPLSEGGMGAVYVAEQLSTRAERALKLMHPQLVRDPALRARFEQEAKIAAQISSDHVVQVIGAGVDAATGMPWLAMELLDGSDLVEASATGRCGATRLREIMEQLCHGLSAAHAQGVVHRDLKPENVFIAAARRPGVPFTVKILDFGIAKVTEQARSSAVTAALGTPLWMAPEQAGAASGTISPATDIWALGLIAFWLLTGRAYWRGAQDSGITLQTLMREVLFDPLVPATQRAAELGYKGPIPAGFDDWFSRAVVRDPSQRYPDARTAFEALSHSLAEPGPSGIGFAEAATAVANADDASHASRPSVPKTIDDLPPLRPATQPAATQHAPQATPPTVAALPYTPAVPVPPAVTPAQQIALPPTGGFGYSASPAITAPPRPSGVGRGLWALATLAVLALGIAAALVITREDWQPYLDAALEPAPAPTAPPIPTTTTAKLICPDGTRASGGRCVPYVDRSCPTGMRFTDRGCVAIVAEPAPTLQPQPTTAPPAPTTGMLTVLCSPACTSVTVDGLNAGASPVVNRVLPAGTHSLILRRAGYTTLHASAVIVAGQTSARRYTLSPSPPPTKKPDKK